MKWILAALLLNTASGADVGVRVIFGLGDLETSKWDGSATARGAEIRLVEPWRFEDGDAIAGQSWRAWAHPIRLLRGPDGDQPNPPILRNRVILRITHA